MKKRFLPLLLSLCLLLTGCGSLDMVMEGNDLFNELYEYYAPNRGEEEQEARLTSFSLPQLQSQTLDPVTCTDGPQQVIGSLLYEGLFRLDGQMSPQPALAESYAYDPIRLIYTITLRSGVTFTDGSILTASDVVATLRRAMASDRYGPRLAHVVSLYTQGSNMVCIRLNQNNTAFPALLDIPIVKSGTERQATPIGTGPYRYVEGSGTQSSYLEYNSSWWRGESLPLQRIELYTCKDSDTAAYAFYAREIQLLSCDLTATNASSVSGSGAYTDADTTIMQYIGMNPYHPLLQNPLVRQALCAGIDRTSCISSFLLGHGKAAQFPISPVSPDYPAALAKDYSPELFQQKMEQAGLTTGQAQTLRLLVNAENSHRVGMARKIASDLSLYDLQVQVEVLPWEQFLVALQTGKFDLYFAECKLTADWDLTQLLTLGGNLNYGGWNDPALTRAINNVLSASAEERGAAQEALYQLLAEQMPLIPIAFKCNSVLTTPGAVDTITPTATEPFFGMKDWVVHIAG